ncbi:MAG: hypothetical protein K8R68_11085 [Bacteroidales bacterium]|nr:hypothetical protein [Bacteroidales bacterium]
MSKYLTTGLADFNSLFGNIEGIEMADGFLTSLLIQGEAGVGKTTLALQLSINMIINNPKKVRCFYLYFDQPKELLSRMLENFNWRVRTFLINDINEVNMGIPLPAPYRDELYIVGINEFLKKNFISIDKDVVCKTIKKFHNIKEDRHTIVVLDSINSIEDMMNFERKNVIEFINEIYRHESTLIFIKEGLGNGISSPSEYVADYIINLNRQSNLYVEKTRLHKCFRGPHQFQIISNNDSNIQPNDFKENGFIVYPNISLINEIEDYKMQLNNNNSNKVKNITINKNKRVSFGIAKLDRHLEVELTKEQNLGMMYSSSLLIKGDAGSLKTELAMKFLYNGFMRSKNKCLFISFRMDEDALRNVAIFNNAANKDKFFNSYFKFYDGRDPFKSASQFMSEIKNEIESFKNIKRVVVFGIGMLNNYTGLKGEVLEFIQVLVKFFKQKEISSVFIDWFKSSEIQETLPSEYAQEFISNQIDIKLKEDRKGKDGKLLREVFIERREHRFSTHNHIGNLYLKGSRLGLD